MRLQQFHVGGGGLYLALYTISVYLLLFFIKIRSNLIRAVKYGYGELMIWACFAAKGPGHLIVIEWTMNSSV